MPGAAISLEDVCKAYKLGDGSHLLAADGVTLDIAPGSRTALIGPSGSGKSTLLHLIGAIDRPDSGTITVDDLVITKLGRNALADYRASIGFIFQQFHLVPSLSLLDNVTAPLVGRRFDGDKRERGRELLAAVGLAGREKALPSQLSGGQQQRVAIARSLVARPKLLLADEPTGNLDSATAVEILDLIAELQESSGATVVMATHDMGVAESCGTIVRIADGRALEAAGDVEPITQLARRAALDEDDATTEE